MRSRPLCIAFSAFVLLVALGANGCALSRTVLDDSVVDRFADPEQELDFWDELATRPVVTNNDALHALLLMTEEEVASPSYESRVAEAVRRGWMSDARRPPEHASATVGMIAMAACDLIDARGGVTMLVFGPSPRVCTKELVFLELLPPRSENQSLSGLEFIDLVNRLEVEQAETTAGAS
ncbi:MAG: hypothetical protein HKO59_04680 [Phycisphaerales bacterium]|nr:hypothetical protein [Phycisphaerae bacterium]NNF43169.1 hypothetical protein [Phycisphaerales bacterium]NNM25272.1 hypothetical protein [Phycisphaerales bacterium]